MSAPTIAIFADVQNIYYTTRQAYQKQFNYRQLWNNIARQGTIVQAYAYAIDKKDSRQQQFQKTLQEIGFQVKLKPYIQRSDGSAKGDWDVGITIDVMDAAPLVDTVILLSGDGDFDRLLERIRRGNNVTAEVYGVRELTAQSLVNACDIFHPITSELLI